MFEQGQRHAPLSKAIQKWRLHNGSTKFPGFGQTHSWQYSNRPIARLEDLEFQLEVMDVSDGYDESDALRAQQAASEAADLLEKLRGLPPTPAK